MQKKSIILLLAIIMSSLPLQPVNAEYVKVLGVQWDFQHKDTPMLCLQGCDYSGDHAWDDIHLEHRTHGDMYCVRASIAMIANYFNNKNGPERISQDRLTYFMTEGNGLGPEYDLKHSESATPLETLAWALGMPPEAIEANIYDARPYSPGNLYIFRDYLDDNRLLLGLWDGHARVIDGYKAGGNFYFHILDPWPTSEPTEEEKWVNFGDIPIGAYILATPAQAPGVRCDDDSIWTDSDSDGVCDFDEINRFFTNPYNEDSDSDSINDKEEILSYNYDYLGEYGPGYYYDYMIQKLAWEYPATVDGVPVALYYLKGNNPLFPYTRFDFSTGADVGWHLNQPLIDLIEMRADMDEDGLRAELDFDSDGDGYPDRAEDKNGNGLFEWWLGETNPHIWDTIPPSTFLEVTPEYYESGSVKYVTSETLHTFEVNEDSRSKRDLENDIWDRYNEINRGIEYTAYRYYPADIEGDPPHFTQYSEPFTLIGSPGEYVLEFYSMDKHGNIEEMKTVHETLSDISVLELEYVYIEGLEYTFNPFIDEDSETYRFEWRFGDSPKSGKIQSYTFPSNGFIPISLTTYEDTIEKKTQSITALVLDTSPEADFTTTGPYMEGSPIQFTDASTSGNDEIVTWSWDFDEIETSTQQNPVHVFKDEGVYSVTLTVTDEDGSRSSVIKEITIENQNPTATLTPISGAVEGEAIKFKLKIMDPGLYDIQNIKWDFGDGSIPRGFGDEPEDPFRPIHAYQQNGIYTVTVYVSDGDGGTDTEIITVSVNNLDPTLNSIGDKEIPWGEELCFTASATDPGIYDALTYSIIDAPAGAIIDPLTGVFSWTPNEEQIGPHVFKVFVSDEDDGTDMEEITVTVTKRATSIQYNGDASGQYSDQAWVSATITDTISGEALSEKSIKFTIGQQNTYDDSDAHGYAETYIVLDQSSGSPGVLSEFEGDDYYQECSVSEPFTIDKEIASITYTGDTLVSTDGETSYPIQLAAHLDQQDDGYPGNIEHATLTFELYRSGNLGSTPDLTYSGITVDEDGEAETTQTIPTDVWTVKVKLDQTNEYWTEDEVIIEVLTVTESTTSSATGGGWVPDETSSNGKDTFGFSVRYQKKNLKTQGNFVYVIRSMDGYNYIVKSNSWQGGGLAFTGENTAVFSGRCVIQQIDRETSELVEAWGNSRFAVFIEDNEADSFALTCSNPDGTFTDDIPATLIGGGNILVHTK